jgi:hypothetical protein
MISRAMVKRIVIAGLLLLGISGKIAALASNADTLKTEIDAFIERIQHSSNDALHWEGAESIDIRNDGADAVATITKGKISFHPATAAPSTASPTFTFDRVEIRRSPDTAGGDRVRFTVKLPALSRLVIADGSDLTLALKNAALTVVVAGAEERQREVALTAASGRIEHQETATWLNFGPLSTDWEVKDAGNGGWTTPMDFALRSIEFAAPKLLLTGTIARVAYTGTVAGPNLAEFDALRDRLTQIRLETDANKKLADMLSVLPKFLVQMPNSKGELTVEQVSAKRPDGAPLMSLAKASFGGSVTGLDAPKAAMRFTLGHDGLTVDPSLVPAKKVASRASIDFGLDEISVPTLLRLAELASQLGPDASDADKQKVLPQLMGAAMALEPVFHLYEASVEFPDVKIDATGEAKRAPPAPIGYMASGDVAVRGFTALAEIVSNPNGRNLLPLLKFIGEPGKDADGAEITKFHLVSQTGKPITASGSDVSGWFAGAGPNGRMPDKPPRLLRLAEPPETGDDVRAVQKAVKAQEVEPFTDGVYDTATALAVARFQKQAEINVSGVVDTATADKLGLKPPATPAFPLPAPVPPGPPPKN